MHVKKGLVVGAFLREGHYDSILVVGDDRTDESMYISNIIFYYFTTFLKHFCSF